MFKSEQDTPASISDKKTVSSWTSCPFWVIQTLVSWFWTLAQRCVGWKFIYNIWALRAWITSQCLQVLKPRLRPVSYVIVDEHIEPLYVCCNAEYPKTRPPEPCLPCRMFVPNRSQNNLFRGGNSNNQQEVIQELTLLEEQLLRNKNFLEYNV